MIYPTLLHTLLKALQQDQREESSTHVSSTRSTLEIYCDEPADTVKF